MCSSSVVVDEAAVVLIVMMKGARVLVKVICVLAVAELAAAVLQMEVVYPDGTSNPSCVRLICRNDTTLRRVSDAQFQKNGVPLSQGPGRDQVTSLVEGDGEVTFTFTQDQEGIFRCVHNDEMSQEINLTGNASGYICCLHVV